MEKCMMAMIEVGFLEKPKSALLVGDLKMCA